MRTVQEILRELDADRLIETYQYQNQLSFIDLLELQDYTFREIRDRQAEKLRGLIARLQTIQITSPEDGHVGILFVHRCYNECRGDLEFCLAHLDEVREKGAEVETFAFEFCPQSEIAGFLVADTELTLKNQYELMADVLHEASFFGYDQENLQKEQERLEKSIREMEEGKTRLITQEEMEAALKDEFGYEPDRMTEEEETAYHKALLAVREYADYSRRKELREIQRGLLS